MSNMKNGKQKMFRVKSEVLRSLSNGAYAPRVIPDKRNKRAKHKARERASWFD